MIDVKNVVFLKIQNKPQLTKFRHPFITIEKTKGRKTFLMGSSNLMKIQQNCGFDGYVKVLSRSERPDSPFDKVTYIECHEYYYIENAQISLDALTNPPTLPDDYFDDIVTKAKNKNAEDKMINGLGCEKLNPGWVKCC